MKYLRRFLETTAETAKTSSEASYRSFHSALAQSGEQLKPCAETFSSNLDQWQRIRSLSLLAEPQEVRQRLKTICRDVCSSSQEILDLALSLVVLDAGIDPEEAALAAWSVLQEIEKQRAQRIMPSEIVALEQQLADFENQGPNDSQQTLDLKKSLEESLTALRASWRSDEQKQIEHCRLQLQHGEALKTTDQQGLG